jgi:co-chaperonin GroES (HSP10)
MELENKLTPMPGRLVVKREDSSNITDSGLWKPDSVVDTESRLNERAIVVAIGEPKTELGQKALTIQVGDKVLISALGGRDYTYVEGGREKYLVVVPYESVIAKVNE